MRTREIYEDGEGSNVRLTVSHAFSVGVRGGVVDGGGVGDGFECARLGRPTGSDVYNANKMANKTTSGIKVTPPMRYATAIVVNIRRGTPCRMSHTSHIL